MRKTIFITFVSIIYSFVFNTSCHAQRKIIPDASQKIINWAGLYKGTFSSKNCNEGQIVTLQINNDLSYTKKSACISENSAVQTSVGSFKWNKLGTEITLSETGTNNREILIVGEGFLRKISENGKKLPYSESEKNSYTKVDENSVAEKYWKLVELYGKPFVMDGQNREPHLILKSSENKVTATGGCNFISGSYYSEQNDSISFSNLVSSRMACTDMSTEYSFIQALGETISYKISEDGNFLAFYNEGKERIMRLEVVYLR